MLPGKAPLERDWRVLLLLRDADTRGLDDTLIQIQA